MNLDFLLTDNPVEEMQNTTLVFTGRPVTDFGEHHASS